VKKTAGTATPYYVRSSVLSGQVVAELNNMGAWTKGYIYQGGQLVATRQSGSVLWVHQDPVTKSQRLTDTSGAPTGTIVDLDPWGGETTKSYNANNYSRKFTSYERDSDDGDEAQQRRYLGTWRRFSQPDPYDGTVSLADPQSLNRYAYTQNDPVNFVDPNGWKC
jgi:RHS repeat-associated protein